MRKIIIAVFAAALALTVFASASCAESLLEVGSGKNVVMDGRISDGEYTASYTLDKSVVDALGGDSVWVGAMTEDVSAKYHLAWSAEGLYVGVQVVGDTTTEYAMSWDPSIDDCVQVNLFADRKANYWFTVGARNNGAIVARTHNTTEETGFSDDLNGRIVGESFRGDNEAVYEFMIPWAYVTNGTTHTAIAEVGEEFSILFAYIDFDGSAPSLAFKSAPVFPGSGANIPVRVRLIGDSPELPTAAPEPSDTDEPIVSGMNTPAIIIAVVAALAVAVIVTVIISKKKKK